MGVPFPPVSSRPAAGDCPTLRALSPGQRLPGAAENSYGASSGPVCCQRRLRNPLVLVPYPPPSGGLSGFVTRKHRSNLLFESGALTEHENVCDVDHRRPLKRDTPLRVLWLVTWRGRTRLQMQWPTGWLANVQQECSKLRSASQSRWVCFGVKARWILVCLVAGCRSAKEPSARFFGCRC